jgi:hypothetical protein
LKVFTAFSSKSFAQTISNPAFSKPKSTPPAPAKSETTLNFSIF